MTGVDTSKLTKKVDLVNLKSKVDKLDVDKLVPVLVDLIAKIKNIDNKTPNVANAATKVSLNAKVNEVKSKIPNITNLASNVSLNAKMRLNVKYLILLT